MKPNKIDLATFQYVTGHTHYDIDLTPFKNAADIYLEIHCKEDVSVDLVQSGSGDVLNFMYERNIKFKAAIINCEAIKICTKKTAKLAYICDAKPHGGYEIMDPRPMAITAAKTEFTLTDMVRRELTKRLQHMGMLREDVDDLLDEEDFNFDDDEAQELPDDTAYTEMEEETLPTEPDETDPESEPTAPPEPSSAEPSAPSNELDPPTN